MQAKFISIIALLVFTMTTFNSHAEYYSAHSLSKLLPACTLYFTYPCQERSLYRDEKPQPYDDKKPHNYVNFSHEGTSLHNTRSRTKEYDSYDQRTAYDDAMRYPDMNNQY